jgi:hypothetical protein
VRDTKRILSFAAITVAVIILCAGAGYIGYSFSIYEAHVNEQNLNYIQGRNEGEKIAAEKAFQEGYAQAIQSSETGNSFTLHNPSYQEMKTFLASDNSDSKPYAEDQHICTDFTADVVNNAHQLGIRCAAVYIIYPETGHSIVAFNNTDKGVILVEPQYDKEVKLISGQCYSVLNDFIKQGQMDDTIIRWIIIW